MYYLIIIDFEGIKMLRHLALFLTLLSFTGCCTGLFDGVENFFRVSWYGGGKVVKQIDSTEVSRVILTYTEKLKWTHGLILEDSVIFYEKYINRIRLDFESMDSLDVWDARKLLVDIVEEFLDRINGNVRIFPYLARTPMTAADLEIYINFDSFQNKYVDLQTVGLLSLRGGITTFIASDGVFDCEIECWHRRSEYYFQSRNFVNFKRQGEALWAPYQDPPLWNPYAEGIYQNEIYKERDLGPYYAPPQGQVFKPIHHAPHHPAKSSGITPLSPTTVSPTNSLMRSGTGSNMVH